MTTLWYGFDCTSHGVVKSKNKDFKCKRLDCSLSNMTTFKFNTETYIWTVDGPMSDPQKILKQLKEPRTQQEYREFLMKKTYKELEGLMETVQINIELDTVGPVFCVELIRAMDECDKSNLK